jgi:hypothetical protein
MPFTSPQKYAAKFYHKDWVDNVDRVQAAGQDGFNTRFHSLEDEFISIQSVMDSLTATAAELQAAVEEILAQLQGTWTLQNLNVPGKLGVGTINPTAKLSVVAPGATELEGSVRSNTFLLSGGTLGTARNDELVLASIGFNTGGNNSCLGVRARRIDGGPGWSTTSIGLGMDVDNTPLAGANLWLHHSGNVGVGTATPSDKLDVAGALRILTNSNPIRFTSNWSGFPDLANNHAEISNDTNQNKTLMLVGNKSAGGPRRVSVWDRLEVNGTFRVQHGVDVNDISADAGLSAASDAVLPTQRAVKTYIDRHPIIQNGYVGIQGTLGNRNGKSTDEDIKSYYVQFGKAFWGTPNVMLGTIVVDAFKERNLRYHVWPDSITPQGFTAFFKTWSDTELYLLTIEWIAYGPGPA